MDHNLCGLWFPDGGKIALRGEGIKLSFGALHSARRAFTRALRGAFGRSGAAMPTRVVGCVDDDLRALLCLLTLPEFCDYLPINPKLSDTEKRALIQSAGADAVIFSQTHRPTFVDTLADLGLRQVCLDDLLSPALEVSTPALPLLPLSGEGRLILHTSGTTGQPKRVPISLAAINASAQNIATALHLGPQDIALNTLPTFHIGGLVDVLLAPLVAGGSVALTAQRDPAGLVAALRAYRPTWMQLVPTMLTHLVETLPADEVSAAAASLSFVRSISAPVSHALRSQGEEALGCPIIEMYGMTEAAGQIVSNSRDSQASRAGSVGRPDLVPVQIMDTSGNPLTDGKIGEVCVSGPTIFEGYEDQDPTPLFHGDWFRTGDLGRLDGEGFLYLEGRLKEMINVGGEKVSPVEIERAALSHPRVADAVAYALPHPTLGEHVGLSLALKHEARTASVASETEAFNGDIKAALHAHLTNVLAPFKVPRHLDVAQSLPRLPNAKVDRLALKRAGEARQNSALNPHSASTAPKAPTPSPPLTPPLSRQDQRIAEAWAKQLGSRLPVGEDDFFDMGGDSLSAVNFLMALEDITGRSVSDSLLFETPTFAKLCQALNAPKVAQVRQPAALRFVRKKMAGWPGQPAIPGGLFRGFGTFQRRRPLFWSCESVSAIRDIQATFGTRHPLYMVQTLFQFRLRRGHHIRQVAKAFAAEIQQIQPEGAIALGGFCGGGLVMEATARELQDQGRKIDCFISFDYWISERTPFPVIQGSAHGHKFSGIEQFNEPELGFNALYPHGGWSFRTPANHDWRTSFWADQLPDLMTALDKGLTTPNRLPDGHWTYEERIRAPKMRLKINSPRLRRGTGMAFPLEVTLTNLDDRPWLPTAQSGLSLVARTYMSPRRSSRNGAYAPLEKTLHPGESRTFNLTVRLQPRKRLQCVQVGLASQGIKNHRHQGSGLKRIWVWP